MRIRNQNKDRETDKIKSLVRSIKQPGCLQNSRNDAHNDNCKFQCKLKHCTGAGSKGWCLKKRCGVTGNRLNAVPGLDHVKGLAPAPQEHLVISRQVHTNLEKQFQTLEEDLSK